MAVAEALLAAIPAGAQPGPVLFVNPTFLFAGSEGAELRISTQTQSPVRYCWNGVERAVRTEDSSGVLMKLTAQDLARPGFGELSMVDTETGETLSAIFVLTGYNVTPRDVVYDRVRKRLYLTTPEKPGDARFPGNSVVALDPESGTIGPALAVGLRPGQMAMSDDASVLYVAVEGDGMVRRLDLATMKVTSEFRYRPVAPAAFGYVHTAIAIFPVDSRTIALRTNPDLNSSRGFLSIYDDGVKRRAELAFADFDSMVFSRDGKYLFTGNAATFNQGQTMVRYLVDATGIPEQKALSAEGGAPVAFVEGLLYSSGGSVIDWQLMEVVGGLGVGGAVTVDAERKRLLVSYTGRVGPSDVVAPYLQAFDLATQTPFGRIRYGIADSYASASSTLRKLLPFGEDGLVMTDPRGLVVGHTPLAGPSPVIRADALGPVTPGETVSIDGENLGPDSPETASEPTSQLGWVQVWFDRKPGAIRYASKSQVNVIVPRDLEPGSNIHLQLWRMGLPSARIPLAVRATGGVQ